MSENVEGQTTEGAEGQNNVTPEMIEKLQSQLDHLKSTNDRLLNESKDWKAKYQGVKDEVTNTKKAELEKEGKLEELLELERNKAHEYQQAVSKMKRDNMKASLKFEVAKFAKDAHDIEDVVRNINFDMVDYNEDSNSFANVDAAVAAVKQSRPYLFMQNNKPGLPNGRPSANVPTEKTLQEKIGENPGEVLEDALKQMFS